MKIQCGDLCQMLVLLTIVIVLPAHAEERAGAGTVSSVRFPAVDDAEGAWSLKGLFCRLSRKPVDGVNQANLTVNSARGIITVTRQFGGCTAKRNYSYTKSGDSLVLGAHKDLETCNQMADGSLTQRLANLPDGDPNLRYREKALDGSVLIINFPTSKSCSPGEGLDWEFVRMPVS